MRRITGAAIAAAGACVAGAVALANFPAAGHTAPPAARKTVAENAAARTAGQSAPRYLATQAPILAAPDYVTVSPAGTATVRRTSTGAKLATVRPPKGATFVAVSGDEADRMFVLAAGTSSGISLYLLLLRQHGQPKGPVVKLAVPPLPGHLGGCPADLAGLALAPQNGGLVAASLLTYCPTGRAGPGEIVTARISSGRILAKFHPGNGYPMWLSWTQSGSLAYAWSGNTTGVFLIPDATSPGSKARLLIKNSAGIGGFSGANYPMITPDGSTVLTTLANASNLFDVAAISAKGSTKKLVIPAVRNPMQFCGPLWADSTGSRMLVACGDGAEFEVQNGQATRLHRPWQLPSYPVPSAAQIAW